MAGREARDDAREKKCSGPLADVCGEFRGNNNGDTDSDGDVPSMADDAAADGEVWGLRAVLPFDPELVWSSDTIEPLLEEQARKNWDPPLVLVRLYWPRDCNGMDEPMPDNLEAE